MPLFLYTVRVRRIVNGADFLLDRIEAKDSADAEEFAYRYLESSLNLRRGNYTTRAELKQEIMES